MTDRPILIPAARMPALLGGRMTQCRVPLKVQPPSWAYPDQKPGWSCMTPKGHIEFRGRYVDPAGVDHGPAAKFIKLPYTVGDRLWCREAHYLTDDGDSEYAVYAEDEAAVAEHFATINRLPSYFPAAVKAKHLKLRPSVHMPRWASRLTLTVTDVRVQRVQEISDEDVEAEGAIDGLHDWDCASPSETCGCGQATYQQTFAGLWDSLNAKRAPWASNPWVCAISFSVAHHNIDHRVAA